LPAVRAGRRRATLRGKFVPFGKAVQYPYEARPVRLRDHVDTPTLTVRLDYVGKRLAAPAFAACVRIAYRFALHKEHRNGGAYFDSAGKRIVWQDDVGRVVHANLGLDD
jgi:hypothetical protein